VLFRYTVVPGGPITLTPRKLPGQRRAALAYRTHDMLDPDNPLHSTEDAVEWRLYGDVVTVVNALLSLPTPEPTESPAQILAAALDPPDESGA